MKYQLTKRIKHHIINNHIFHLVLGVFFGIGLILRVIGSNAQTDTFFPFNTFIAGYTNTVNINFKYGGNNFTGLLARSGWLTLSTPETVHISGSNSDTATCYQQLIGFYYNPIRGSKLWPLDNRSLIGLQSLDSSYSDMVANGGIYTNCTGANIDSDFVIGQVVHSQRGVKYTLFAGLSYDKSENTMSSSQDISAGTLVYDEGVFAGSMFDLYGGGIGDIGNSTSSTISIGGFTGAVFCPGISNVVNAEPGTLYQSSIFSVVGLSKKTLMTISSGTLYINDVEIGTTGMVANNDELKIDLYAGDEYDQTEICMITIGDLTGSFSVTTKEQTPDVCALTKTEKEDIEAVFDDLVDEYGTGLKLTTLMSTMQSMIDDMQDFDYDCNLEYLNSLAEDYLDENDDDTEDEDSSTHTAPNCKKYAITYNEDKQGYTSSNLRVKQYFATRVSLYKFIDSKNPGDCQVSSYDDEEDYGELADNVYVAPNGKVYEIVEEDGIFYSSTMTVRKEFGSREALLYYIDRNNPSIDVWDHEVDTDWEPVTYAASNGKEYKIYKTDKGYMSYKLVKVQYFSTQEEIIAYIEKNNK